MSSLTWNEILFLSHCGIAKRATWWQESRGLEALVLCGSQRAVTIRNVTVKWHFNVPNIFSLGDFHVKFTYFTNINKRFPTTVVGSWGEKSTATSLVSSRVCRALTPGKEKNGSQLHRQRGVERMNWWAGCSIGTVFPLPVLRLLVFVVALNLEWAMLVGA